MLGSRYKKAAISGLAGGMGGLVIGQVGGNTIEAERRRRNAAENLTGGNAEQYLGKHNALCRNRTRLYFDVPNFTGLGRTMMRNHYSVMLLLLQKVE